MAADMAPDMEVHMVADMEVDKVTDKVADMFADIVTIFLQSCVLPAPASDSLQPPTCKDIEMKRSEEK